MKKEEFVPGNHTAKYSSKNPIKRYLVNQFLTTFDTLVSSASITRKPAIAEVGCAEGELLKHLHAIYPQARLHACDLDTGEVAKAKQNTSDLSVRFTVQNAENLKKYQDNSFDLVTCCEVLEHVEKPEKALAELARISRKFVLVSVPNEPIWRVLNFCTGNYMKDWGNTPGHLNHWSLTSFQQFLSTAPMEMVSKEYPFPWQMYLLQVK